MRPLFLSLFLGATALISIRPASAAPPRVFYAGGAGIEKIASVMQLSDRSVLAAGSCDDLTWLPAGTPVSTLSAPDIHNAAGSGRIGFLMQMSRDLGSIIRVVALPKGAAQDISKVKLVGSNLFISGTTSDSRAAGGGYFLAKLDGNFTAGAPTRALWTYNVWASGDHQSVQPWDVGGDGKIVFVTGQPFGADWCAVHRLNQNGQLDVVPKWRTHWTDTSELRGEIGTNPDVRYSGLVFKPKGRADLRSWTDSEYNAVTPDGAGGTRKGTWPLDAFFNSPANPQNAGATASGPGYTGYNLGASATARVAAIAINPIDNSIYIGFSVQSRLPDGNPDFEPAVIAFDHNGARQWWSRLYTETSQNSTPDQYVDGLAVDAKNGQLVVLARCHGNNVNNLWNGNGTFQKQFTGTNGNIHISWLGKLNLQNGQPSASTFVAEYTDGMENTGAAYSDPNLDGWADHNAGWPQLNTTRCGGEMRLDGAGRIYLTGVGRRTITTAGAFQKMIKKSEGISSWNAWVRVYTPDLKSVVYSSILTGQWDKTSGAGGDNTQINALCPTDEGLIAVGASVARGNPMPTTNVPVWGAATPQGVDAIVASMLFLKAARLIPAATVEVLMEVEPSGGNS